ncbi:MULTISPECIES: DUF1127 domain-containing protein [Rhizobium]|jgi:uncharacterized protein YjiS (DUF1127 family)|uniref:YjiS-like domain-containing protein n=1 Tax=Rhizobium lusitanum TaxID=293958 RepID=A0A1C3WVK1_9HYPH|nr:MULTISPECIES: DUF1127 domain-containing protein [Rhizobium]NKJ06513.1 uncharacterized protein YjiS (DUF1127 family) [Rhizobium sp. SG741]NKJ39267.1 uncharacterized protein YjiS (DUF1127 family) [Rhizobium sp. SG570]NTJ10676.1 DUF1127 domain-containing protein [Rhizobium lusitanum]SCB44083.1 protein of unknown function [Rhizobium lusitanum]
MQSPSITISSARIRVGLKVRRTPLSAIAAVARLLMHKMNERRNRNALLELSDDQLKDIGLSRGQAGSDVHVYSRY